MIRIPMILKPSPFKDATHCEWQGERCRVLVPGRRKTIIRDHWGWVRTVPTRELQSDPNGRA